MKTDPPEQHGEPLLGSTTTSSSVAAFHGEKAKGENRGVTDIKCTRKKKNSNNHSRPASALDWSTSVREWEGASWPSRTGGEGAETEGKVGGESAKKEPSEAISSRDGVSRVAVFNSSSRSNACKGHEGRGGGVSGGEGSKAPASLPPPSLPPYARVSHRDCIEKNKGVCNTRSIKVGTGTSSNKPAVTCGLDEYLMDGYCGKVDNVGWWPEALSAVEDGSRIDIYSGSILDGSWLESLDNRLSATVRATRR